MTTPITNEIWQHHSGRLYKIVCVANENAESWETEVVYRDLDGNVWARPLAVFLRKFKLSPALPPIGTFGERVYGRMTVGKSCQIKTDKKGLKMVIGEPNSIQKILEAAFKQIEKEHDVHLEIVEFETRQLPRGIGEARVKREVVAITWKATSA